MTKTTRRQTLQLFTAGAFLGLAPGMLSTPARAAVPALGTVVVKNFKVDNRQPDAVVEFIDQNQVIDQQGRNH